MLNDKIQLIGIHEVDLDDIAVIDDIQSRASRLDEEIIEDYAEKYREGCPMPPIKCAYDAAGKSYILAEGLPLPLLRRHWRLQN